MYILNMKKYNVLVIGSEGMLGSAMMKFLREYSVKKDSSIKTVRGIADALSFVTGVSSEAILDFRYVCPDVIINCAAYTDTAGCQKNSQAEISYALNCLLPKKLAQICCSNKHIKLIHVSTDYVYSEYSKITKYNQEFPVNAYGMQKLLGEKMIIEEFNKKQSTKNNYLIVRTSWLFSTEKTNKHTFITKFANACINKICEHNAEIENYLVSDDVSQDKPIYDIDVTDNQGFPTSVEFLSRFIVKAVEIKAYGVIHGYEANLISRATYAEYILDSLNNEYASVPFDCLRVNCIPDEVKSEYDMRHPRFANNSTKFKRKFMLRDLLPSWLKRYLYIYEFNNVIDIKDLIFAHSYDYHLMSKITSSLKNNSQLIKIQQLQESMNSVKQKSTD